MSGTRGEVHVLVRAVYNNVENLLRLEEANMG